MCSSDLLRALVTWSSNSIATLPTGASSLPSIRSRRVLENEELLIRSEIQPFVWGIRRVLANMNNVERAASVLVKGLRATNDNEEFLIRSAKKAQQSNEYIA